MNQSLSAEEIAELRDKLRDYEGARPGDTIARIRRSKVKLEALLFSKRAALLAMASRLVEIESGEYARLRAVRGELLGIIAAQARRSDTESVTSEWLAAFAPELASGDFSKLGWPGPTTAKKGG